MPFITARKATCRAFAFTVLAALCLYVAALATLQGCTAGQLAGADHAVGGSSLGTPASQPATQPATASMYLHVIQDAAPAASGVAARFGPVGLIVSGVLTLLGGLAGTLAVKQTAKANSLQSLVADAAPQVAKIVGQVTDNQTLASDVTNIAQVAPAVIALLAHPAAGPAAASIAASAPAAK